MPTTMLSIYSLRNSHRYRRDIRKKINDKNSSEKSIKKLKEMITYYKKEKVKSKRGMKAKKYHQIHWKQLILLIILLPLPVL